MRFAATAALDKRCQHSAFGCALRTQITAADGAGDRKPAWSPDGKWIAYVTTPNADANLIAGSGVCICGCCPIRSLIECCTSKNETPARVMHAGFGTPHLAVASSDGSSATTPTVLTEALDRNVSSPFFVTTGADESSYLIFFSVEDSGRVELASICRGRHLIHSA